MELKIGKMSSKELAQWLGISYSTYKNNIDKQLEKLTMYADFEKIYGGVNIKEVYIKEYDKNLNYKNDILFLKEIQTCNDSIATITGMTRKYENYFEDIGQRSVRRQLTESRDRLFGKSNGLEPSKGVMGMREYIWAIKVSEMNEYRYLTKEENELFDALIKKVYGNVEPERAKGAAMLDKLFKNSDMSKEEYFRLRETSGFDFFHEVLSKFKEVTGYVITHATKYEIITGAFDGEESEYRDTLLREIERLK